MENDASEVELKKIAAEMNIEFAKLSVYPTTHEDRTAMLQKIQELSARLDMLIVVAAKEPVS